MNFEPQPDEDELFCDDPTHPSDCACGADPNYTYERGLEL